MVIPLLKRDVAAEHIGGIGEALVLAIGKGSGVGVGVQRVFVGLKRGLIADDEDVVILQGCAGSGGQRQGEAAGSRGEGVVGIDGESSAVLADGDGVGVQRDLRGEGVGDGIGIRTGGGSDGDGVIQHLIEISGGSLKFVHLLVNSGSLGVLLVDLHGVGAHYRKGGVSGNGVALTVRHHDIEAVLEILNELFAAGVGACGGVRGDGIGCGGLDHLFGQRLSVCVGVEVLDGDGGAHAGADKFAEAQIKVSDGGVPLFVGDEGGLVVAADAADVKDAVQLVGDAGHGVGDLHRALVGHGGGGHGGGHGAQQHDGGQQHDQSLLNFSHVFLSFLFFYVAIFAKHAWRERGGYPFDPSPRLRRESMAAQRADSASAAPAA